MTTAELFSTELEEIDNRLSDIIRAVCDAMTDPELLSLAIKVSGLSVREFARRLPDAPNSRTVFRWLAGHHPLSQTVREICTRMVLGHVEEPQ